jgi:LEA14-like dessication related protein
VLALEAREFDRSRAMLGILNPGASLAVDRAQSEVPLNGLPFASGVMALQAQVPAKGRQRLTMGLSLAYLDMPFAARSKIQRGEALEVVARVPSARQGMASRSPGLLGTRRWTSP